MSDLLSCTTKLDEPRVLYVCCTASRELRGLMEWSIPRIPSSRLFMSCVSPRVSYVRIPHVDHARQGYTPFKRRMSEVGRCPCSGLTHGCCKTPDFHRKSESLYLRDSPWISGYRVQNISQINTQSHTSHHIKLIVHEFITSPLWSTSIQASWLNQSENSTQR
jgi:hypothetical protein